MGVKRRCLSCSKPFFDLNRTPIICPMCKTQFEVIEIAHSAMRRPPMNSTPFNRRPAPTPVAVAEDLPVVEDAEDESAVLLLEDEDEDAPREEVEAEDADEEEVDADAAE